MKQFASSCYYIIICLIVLLSGCLPQYWIYDYPISFSEERISLTKVYINRHYGLEEDHFNIIPKIIVLHWTALPTFEKSYSAFNREYVILQGQIYHDKLNVSSHFLVDRNGKIFRLLPETWMAKHVIGISYCAVGIENVGGSKGKDDLTREQVQANAWLVRYLVSKYPTIEYLIGHHQYRAFEHHPLFLEREDDHRNIKIDPGDAFVNEVRDMVKDLRLKGVQDILLEAEQYQENH